MIINIFIPIFYFYSVYVDNFETVLIFYKLTTKREYKNAKKEAMCMCLIVIIV